jgi:hypothetical protein
MSPQTAVVEARHMWVADAAQELRLAKEAGVHWVQRELERERASAGQTQGLGAEDDAEGAPTA